MALALRIPPPLLALASAAVMFGLARLLPPLAWNRTATLAATLVLVGLGLAIELAAIIAFRRAKTTINPLTPNASSQLVTAGLYRYSRNPMYVGLCLQLLAWATFLAAPLALLGVVLFILLVSYLQILPEERALNARFGDDYRRYLSQTKRWL
ncbi:isoprenylcysteine carboxylmethyltransferase family protein [Halioxenophilus sp. WMMB6]|uniref:methyltransferase family protein n=1 Tax=Halioxenophilus sp. WMMB6 TaxID=3073815 RepID=UPI00295E6D4B|nr:isoprenylcysteine carboxylmethyltransferase family protein [Halioxenophilus sp. WMMB6]